MTTPPATNAPSKPNAAAPVAEAGKRGRKPGQEARVRPDIPSGEMILIPLTGKTKADRRRKREDRKPQQKAVDQVVYDVFQENVDSGYENGTIADWADLFVYDWAVTETHAENAEFMIRKACMLYHRKPIWGEQLEIKASESHMIPDPEDEDNEIPCHLNGKNHKHIPFSVVRRPHRTSARD